MADMKKEQERDELHKAIWSIADDLRGSVDGWDFKEALNQYGAQIAPSEISADGTKFRRPC